MTKGVRYGVRIFGLQQAVVGEVDRAGGLPNGLFNWRPMGVLMEVIMSNLGERTKGP